MNEILSFAHHAERIKNGNALRESIREAFAEPKCSWRYHDNYRGNCPGSCSRQVVVEKPIDPLVPKKDDLVDATKVLFKAIGEFVSALKNYIDTFMFT
ncbi:MAG TPA: hypothetical protein V6C76_11910 [Drouetiella sp.]